MQNSSCLVQSSSFPMEYSPLRRPQRFLRQPFFDGVSASCRRPPAVSASCCRRPAVSASCRRPPAVSSRPYAGLCIQMQCRMRQLNTDFITFLIQNSSFFIQNPSFSLQNKPLWPPEYKKPSFAIIISLIYSFFSFIFE